ncbi:MAG: ice-binding family protein [Cyclobacteriaceae bacterium]
MRKGLLHITTAVLLLLLSSAISAQAPNLGTAKDFVLFTSVGAMQNIGTYQYLTLLTGNVGTNSGSNTNFGNVNGVMHAGDGASSQCGIDLQIAYDFLAAAIPDSTIVNPVLGNGATFIAGTYQLPGATTLENSITLDAQGNPNAVFIFKMPAGPPVYAFSTSVNAEVKLVNGAQAANVFWYVTGAVSMGANTVMKGTIVAGGSIAMSVGNKLEGRALTINGQVTVNNGDIGLSAHLPVDVTAPLLSGPAAPVFVESKPYAVFSTIGDVSDVGTSHVSGSVGSNTALPTGYNPLYVSGNIEGMNPATSGAAADLLLVYNSLNTLTADIELLSPAQFGHNLVLTPHAYVLNSAVSFTDTVIFDATGNEDGVFIIKTYGAFASGVNSKVILKNGAQAKNIYWMVNGAVSIGDNSIFKGTIIANNGAIDLLKGSTIDGRALTTNGSVSTTGMKTVLPIPLVSITPEKLAVCDGDSTGFVVTAIGKGLYTFQWRKGTVNLVNSANISGVTNDTLIIKSVGTADIGSDYNVLVFDSQEPSDTTANASLSYHPVPTLTKAPVSQAVCIAGNSASFTVTAAGSGLTYQWRKGTVNLTNTGNISGATSETLTISAVAAQDAAADYNVVVSETCGRTVTSANVALSISNTIVINTEPVNQTQCQGSAASFSVVATGEGLTYQWRKGTVNLKNTGNIGGATSAMLTVYAVSTGDVASDYNVIVSGACENGVTSANASLATNPTPAAPTATLVQPTCSESTGTVTVSSSLTGLTFSIDGSTYTNTSGVFASVASGTYNVTSKNASGCISLATSVTLIKCTYVWTGTTNTVWETSTNWSGGIVPNATGDVTIADVTNDPVISGTVNIKDLEIQTGATLTVNSGAALAIMGKVTGAGNAIIKRKTNANLAYSIIGSPIVNATIAGLGAQLVYQFDGTNFTVPTGNMTRGKGYFTAFNGTAPEVTFTGKPNSGAISKSVVLGGDNFNVVSNPYAAAISRTDFISANGSGVIDGNIWLWDDGGSNVGGKRGGDYIAVNNVGSTSTVDLGDGVAGSETAAAFNGNIGSVQGFLVLATADANISFAPTMQVTTTAANNDANHFRTAGIQKVRISLAGNGLFNDVLIAFAEGATEGKDYGLDAEKYSGNELMSFYSTQADQKYAIQTLAPIFLESREVQLGMDLGVAETYTVGVHNMENMEGLTLMLTDNLTGESKRMTTGSTYTFSAGVGSIKDRFSLTFSNAILGVVGSKSDALMTVFNQADHLIVRYPSKSLEEMVIYTMSGQVVRQETVQFSSGEAVLDARRLSPNQLYILRVNNQSVKFILNQ